MMTFDDFKEYLKLNIKSFLPEEYREAEISFPKVKKNNNLELDSILIRKTEDTVIPNLYINECYEDYREGVSLNHILKTLSEEYHNGMTQKLITKGTNLDIKKDEIVIQLVNREMNAEMLNDVPHKIQNNLAVIFRWIASKDENGLGTVLINNSMMQQLGLNEEELYEVAKENTLRLFPPKICSMKEALMGFTDGYVPVEEFQIQEKDMDFPMYIISNESGVNGAAVILYQDILDEVANKLKGNIYLLPSSIHEMIAVPVNANMSVRELENMVQGVNQDVVSQNEVLSNQVFMYDKESKCIINASEKVREANLDFVKKFLKNSMETNNEEMEIEP